MATEKIQTGARKRRKVEVEKAAKSAEKEFIYKYTLYTNRNVMADYMSLCKKMGKKPGDEINRFIKAQLSKYNA